MSILHVRPLRDLVAHDLDEQCVCGPDVEAVPAGADGRTGVLVLHHSLDGRELRERAR